MGEVKESGLREVLLSNEVFLRLARGFEIYQNALAETKDESEKLTIKNRMESLYGNGPALSDDSEREQQTRQFLGAKNEAFRLCEHSQFTIEKLADMLVGTGFAEHFLRSISHKAGDVEEGTGCVMVNSVVGYALADKGVMSLHIKPTSIKDFSEVMASISAGFAIVAKKMAGRDFDEIKEIDMESWLLGSDFIEKIRQFFGDDVVTAGPSSPIAEEEVQLMALHYNNRSLEKFLKTGEKPEVRSLVMSREEFIEKFAQNNR